MPPATYGRSKITMALLLKTGHAFKTEDFESDKIVNFVILKKHEEDRAKQEDLPSFEALMLPHLDAAYNLARWLVRNEQDRSEERRVGKECISRLAPYQ